VATGTLADKYTGETINFVKGNTTSSLVQIDHIIPLSDAWQKGAQQLSADQRKQLANDPLNMMAADGPDNSQKGDKDASVLWSSFSCHLYFTAVSSGRLTGWVKNTLFRL
jgi:hypothetical protein